MVLAGDAGGNIDRLKVGLCRCGGEDLDQLPSARSAFLASDICSLSIQNWRLRRLVGDSPDGEAGAFLRHQHQDFPLLPRKLERVQILLRSTVRSASPFAPPRRIVQQRGRNAGVGEREEVQAD